MSISSIQSVYSQADKAISLINNKDMSDICFLVGSGEDKKKIYGHKMMLGMGSPVFKKMFYGDLAEKRSLIEIPDLTPNGFMNMIRYIYGEKRSFPLHEQYETFMAGDKYMVYNLCDVIREYLKENLNEENKVLIYDQLVKINNIETMKDHGLLDKVIHSISKSAFSSDHFNKISEDTLIELLSMPNLDVEEICILKSCLNWINESKSTIEEKRSSFKSISSYIDFSRITIDDLKDIDQIDSFLTKEEVVDLFLYLVNPKERPCPFKSKIIRKQFLSVNFKVPSILQWYRCNWIRAFIVPLSVNYDISIKSIETSLPSSLRGFEFELHSNGNISTPKFSKIFQKEKFSFAQVVLSNVCSSSQEMSELVYGPNRIVFLLDDDHCIEKFNFYFNGKSF